MPLKTGSAERAVPEALARFGFLARGFVYLLVGFVAARVAVLQHGRAMGPAGAIAHTLVGWPGRSVLVVVAAGLFAFVLFRSVQLVRTQASLPRVAYLVSALGGLVLAIAAVRILLALRPERDPGGLREAGARLLEHAWGRAGLSVGGAVAVVAGVVEIVRAFLGRVPADFAMAIMPRERKRRATWIARVGMLAHGLVIAVAGYSVVRAALDHDSGELGGTATALRALSSGGGYALFALVAGGLVAYGVSLLFLAAHRRRKVSS